MRSASAQVLLLGVHPSLLERVLELYGKHVDPARLQAVLDELRTLPRTPWIYEVAHRYLFERAVCDKHHNVATDFLERELVKEGYFVARDAEDVARARRSNVESNGPVVERALRWLEGRIFEEAPVSTIARAVHASPSTLLRAFRRTLGQTPSEYIRGRRLDEALVLLRSGRLSVGEIAVRVGYQNFAAFSQAFRARFGKSPSTFLLKHRD
jgi:AraC-like DNA-binding protein